MRFSRAISFYVIAISLCLGLVPFLSPWGAEWGAVRNWHYGVSGITALLFWRAGWRGFTEDGLVSLRLKRLYFLSILLFCLTLQMLRYFSLGINGVDFSIFDWMLYNSHEGRWGYSPIYDVNHFGVHANWVLLPLVVLHKMWPSHGLLVAGTALAIAGAAYVLWGITVRCVASLGLGHDKAEWPAYFLVTAFVTSPQVSQLLDGGFRPEVLFPVLGFGLIASWQARKGLPLFVTSLLFLCIKEDAAVYLVAFSFGMVWTDVTRWRWALLLSLSSIVFFVGYIAWLQPQLLAPYGLRQPGYLQFWGSYGTHLREILLGMAQQPLKLVGSILTSGVTPLFLSALLLPILSRHTLLTLAPGIFMLGTADYPLMHRLGSYYSAPLLPFFFWGLAEAWPRLQQLRLGESGRRILWLSGVMLFPLVGAGYAKSQWPSASEHASLEAAISYVRETPHETLCIQTILVPHWPYELPWTPLFEGCMKDETATKLIHLGRDPWPHARAEIESQVLQAESQGRAVSFGNGIWLISKSPVEGYFPNR